MCVLIQFYLYYYITLLHYGLYKQKTLKFKKKVKMWQNGEQEQTAIGTIGQDLNCRVIHQ